MEKCYNKECDLFNLGIVEMKKEIKIILDEIAEKFNEAIKEVEQLVEDYTKVVYSEEEKQGRWKPQIDEKYFTLDRVGNIDYYIWKNYESDQSRYNQRILFKTIEEAEERKRFDSIEVAIMDIADELGSPTEEDWENKNSKKYHLWYCYSNTMCLQDYTCLSKHKDIFCLSSDFLNVCFERIGKEDLKFYLTSRFV